MPAPTRARGRTRRTPIWYVYYAACLITGWTFGDEILGWFL